jgi:hypothetical protein
MCVPKGIDEAGVYEALETGAFFESETVGPDVFLGAGEVKCRVCHVKIAATHHGFVLFEVLEIGEEARVPILALGQAAQIAFGVGDIDRDYEIRGKLHREHTAFTVVALDTHIVAHGQRGNFRENRRASITPSVGPVPVLVGV